MNLHIKVRGPYFVAGETIPPGSVVSVDEDTAKQLIKRGMGTLHTGPASRAEPPDHAYGTKADGTPMKRHSFDHPEPERADLGNKLARGRAAGGASPAGAPLIELSLYILAGACMIAGSSMIADVILRWWGGT